MRIVLIRHGMTAGNLRHAYIGRTDEPLCEEGIAALPAAVSEIRAAASPGPGAAGTAGTAPGHILAVSPMQRCRQTAQLLFPGEEQRIIPDFRECDFGAFEGKNADELAGDPAFAAWIDSGGEAAFPGGETPAAFKERCCAAFAKLLQSCAEAEGVIIVAHGGTIMAVMERYAVPKKGYYEWHIDNAGGYAAEWDGTRLRVLQQF